MTTTKNAFISSTVILTVLVIFAGLFGWYYLQNSQALNNGLFAIFFEQTVLPDTTDWKDFNHAEMSVKLQHPPTRYNYNNLYLSQFPYSPQLVRPGDVYNTISFGKITSQKYLGYSNSTFFRKLYNLKINSTFQNEYYASDKTVYTLLSKGRIKDGKQYVVIKIDSVQGKIYVADVLVENTLYEIYLIAPNEEGIKVFQDIVKTTVIN